MSSVPSGSSQFHQLHRGVQSWIWGQQWASLRPIQEEAIPVILAGRDTLLSAPTAGGKTEAAFLPIASTLAEARSTGLGCICVSPLKALINDQHERLVSLFESVNLPAYAWHGDIPQAQKKKALESTNGILLITPESLEALFILKGSRMRVLWRGLRYLVVDELHAFIGSERGRQLQSLLNRIEAVHGKLLPRIGLSATLGDMNLAAEFLRPLKSDEVVQIKDTSDVTEIQIQVRGYIQRPPLLGPKQAEQAAKNGRTIDPEDVVHGGTLEIAEHLFKVLRGGKHLVFANSRGRTEEFSDLLRRRCERERIPNEFFPHHGSLSKELREDAERILKTLGRPGTILATTTLELGIDVGEVQSVAQVGVPPSVASLRQRLGRSGRNGKDPSVLRVYVAEEELIPDGPIQDALRAQTFQTVAMLDLLLQENFCEAPDPHQLHLSTLVQQLLSCIAERGGIRANAAFALLCGRGPFGNIFQSEFAALLRHLADLDLVAQTGDGDLVLGLRGEELVGHYQFYAAFSSAEEYQLIAGGRTLGSLPIVTPIFEGMLLIFAGQRWKVLQVDEESKTLILEASAGGVPPLFDGAGFAVDDRIRVRMRELYESEIIPKYLNQGAQRLLREGRMTYKQLRLAERMVFSIGRSTYILPWAGSRTMNALLVWLARGGFEVGDHGVLLAVDKADASEVLESFKELARATDLTSEELAGFVRNLEQEKYDVFLPLGLARANYARRNLDLEGARRWCRDVV